MTIFLRAPDEPSLQSALATMGLWSAPGTDAQGQQTGGYVLAGPWGHLDVIGQHYSKVRDTNGNVVMTTDSNGSQTPQMQLQPNAFLANLVTTDTLSPEVTAMLDSPATPSRVFAT